jgi:hypothetical protein
MMSKKESHQNATKDTLEMRRKWQQIVFSHQENLFAAKVSNETLKTSLQFLSPETYREVNIERATIGVCGYPLCEYLHVVPSGKYKIIDKVVVHAEKTKYFCGRNCWIASEYLKSQLDVDAVYVRTFKENKQFEFLAPRVKHVLPQKDNADLDITNTTTSMSNLSIKSQNKVKGESLIPTKREIKPSNTNIPKKRELLKSKDDILKPCLKKLPLTFKATEIPDNLLTTTTSLFNELKLTPKPIFQNLEIKPRNSIESNANSTNSEIFKGGPFEIEGYVPKQVVNSKKYVKFVDSLTPIIENESISETLINEVSSSDEEDDIDCNFDFFDSDDDDSTDNYIAPTLFTSVWSILSGLSTEKPVDQNETKKDVELNVDAALETTITHLHARVVKTAARYGILDIDKKVRELIEKFNYKWFKPAMTHKVEVLLTLVILSRYFIYLF